MVIDVQKSPLLQKTARIILKNLLLFAALLYFAYLHAYSLHVRQLQGQKNPCADFRFSTGLSDLIVRKMPVIFL